MRIEPAELLRDALSLPAEARAALADSLLESLDSEADNLDEGVQEAWRNEIDRRLRQIDTNTVSMVPWDEARCALRSRLQH